MEVANVGSAPTQVRLLDYYTQQTAHLLLEPIHSFSAFRSLEQFYGWYDITVEAEGDSNFSKTSGRPFGNGRRQHDRSRLRLFAFSASHLVDDTALNAASNRVPFPAGCH